MLLGDDVVLYALSANQELAKRVSKELDVPLSEARIERFPSGEIIACPKECV